MDDIKDKIQLAGAHHYLVTLPATPGGYRHLMLAELGKIYA